MSPTPEWYKVKNLDYQLFKDIHDTGHVLMHRADRSTEIYPIAVSNDLSDVHESIGLYCRVMEKQSGSPLLAVTRSYGAGSPRGTGYHMWLTPNYALNCPGIRIAAAHEIAHAYVGSCHQHDGVWEDLYYSILARLNRTWKFPEFHKEMVETRGGKHSG